MPMQWDHVYNIWKSVSLRSVKKNLKEKNIEHIRWQDHQSNECDFISQKYLILFNLRRHKITFDFDLGVLIEIGNTR